MPASRTSSANPSAVDDASITTVRGLDYTTAQPIQVDIQGGKFLSVTPLPPREAAGGNLPTIAPGFVDLQVNGYLGLDFNTLPIAEEMTGKLIRLLWREGVTS